MPPLVEDVKTCFRNHNRFAEVLGRIARGVDGQTAMQMAREVLIECGVNTWRPEDDASKAGTDA